MVQVRKADGSKQCFRKRLEYSRGRGVGRIVVIAEGSEEDRNECGR